MTMKAFIKKIVKLLIKKTIIFELFKQNRKANSFFTSEKYQKILSDEKIKKSKRRKCYNFGNKINQLKRLLAKITISIDENSQFQHWIDTGLFCCNKYELTDALSPNYELILNNSISGLIKQNVSKNNVVEANNYELLNAIYNYVERIVQAIDKKISKSKGSCLNLVKTRESFENMLSKKASTLEDGLQRILFWSSLFWQTGHTLIGLGRLDKILDFVILPEDDDEVISTIMSFYKALHQFYPYKSNTLLGDTGQIIILGGKNDDGYFNNKLTYLFIKALMFYNKPDPKLLIRVSSSMPSDLLELVLKCNASGVGGPLLSNDDVIIPALENLGYTHEDALNYITSACWEPFCYGKALGRGNLGDINYALIFENTYSNEAFTKCKSFDELLDIYLTQLKIEVKKKLERLDTIKWEYNPLMSLFTENCKESGKDISCGGAIYNDYGLLTVGLANAINSLLTIKKMVFTETESLNLTDVKKLLQSNFVDNETLRKELSEVSYFGINNDEVLELINIIIKNVYDLCSEYHNIFGGKVKFGFSSSNYLLQGNKTGTTFDGRTAGQPLSVHISAKLGTPYTELLNFASNLKYDGIYSNGNVVDMFFSPDMISKNFDKFLILIKTGIEIGFFQLQMNVVGYNTLIEAKKNPELYPDLIVRVWGFCAYFKDLPEEYKDVLINRAAINENVA